MQRIIGINHTGDVINLSASFAFTPNEQFDFAIDDSAVDEVLANLVTYGVTNWRAVQLDPGEVCRLGQLELSLSGAIVELTEEQLRNVSTVFVTATAPNTTIAGIGGGYEGREITVINASPNVNNTLSLLHLEAAAPPTSRMSLPGRVDMPLTGGTRLVYRAGGIWYAL